MTRNCVFVTGAAAGIGRATARLLNIEWQDDAIRVMDVMPMFVNTAMVKDMKAKSIQRLGAKLAPDDVANVIWKAATYQGGLGKVHWPVGMFGVWMHRLSGMTPERISRCIARQIAT